MSISIVLLVAASMTAYWASTISPSIATQANQEHMHNDGTSAGMNESIALPADSEERIDTAVAARSAATGEFVLADQLRYLVEEEKLAHDVYTFLNDMYGAKTFANITASETRHQESVAELLAAMNIADPRSSELGVFTDQSLQRLYDELVAQGSQSLTEAYKVGVTIEEVDIADLRADLAMIDASEIEVIQVMENLLRGSENHLRAFSRHI